MADTVKKQDKPVKDSWLTISGIRKEIKRVRWPQWKSEGANPGIIENSTSVVLFTGSFAVFFIICEFLVTYVLKFMGIGA